MNTVPITVRGAQLLKDELQHLKHKERPAVINAISEARAQGDLSEKGLAQAWGLMVNYLYELDDIEENHEAFADRGEIIASSEVRQHLRRKAPAKPVGKSLEKPAPEPAGE